MNSARLRKLLLLALSAEGGERDAAISRLKHALHKDGKDIHWLADKLTQDAPVATSNPFSRPSWQPTHSSTVPWWDMLLLCVTHISELGPWEQEFVASLSEQRVRKEYWQPSERQYEALRRAYNRVVSMQRGNQ